MLDQSSIFAKTSSETTEKMRNDLKYGYSKEVLSLNILLDQNLDQFVSLNNQLDVSGAKRYEQQTRNMEQVDWLIE